MNDYKILFEKIDMPRPAVEVFERIYAAIKQNAAAYADYIDIRDKYFAGDTSFEHIEAFAAKYGFDEYEASLTLTIMFTSTMRRIYCEKDYPEDVYYASLRDLAIWTRVCIRDYGVWGLREYGWLANQLRGEIFRLGRLQFHYQKFAFDSFTKSGHTVHRGDTVVNMHIPEGEPLTAQARLDSYRRAYKFFNCGVFVCESWLLYPKHEEFLPKSSNVLSFMHDFDIIDSDEAPDMSNMWRIWGRRDKYDPSTLERDTSFRRAYADWLAKTGMTGNGYGVFFFDGENIIKSIPHID